MRKRGGVATGDSISQARYIRQSLMDKKGQHIVILDMREVTLIADFFVIATGQNVAHLDAMATAVQEAMQEQEASLLKRSGGARAHWILLDYGGVVVHLFTEEERQYYNLERLWGDASVVAADSEQAMP